MIDTHTHINSSGSIGLLDYIVLAGANLEDSKENIEAAKKNKKLLAAVGIHPQEKIYDLGFMIYELEELLKNNPEIVAVGECGLEFTEGVDKKAQERLFRAQICLALKYKKALIVHSREAAEETLAILGDYKNLRGVIHCYSGGKKRIKKIIEALDPPSSNFGEAKWYFGIDGNLTYEIGLEEVVKNIPKDRLVLETDSPWLTPVPHRGEKNKPEYVKFVYEKVAKIWEMSFEETEKIIDANAKKLFLI